VQVFTELALEAVEHEFGSGFPSWIFLDHGAVEGCFGECSMNNINAVRWDERTNTACLNLVLSN